MNKLILFLCLAMVTASFATETRTVKICPAGCDYTTISAAEIGEDGDITATTGTDEIVHFEIDSLNWATAGANPAVYFDGWKTSAGNYIYIYTTSLARHSGYWDDNKYRIEGSSFGGVYDNITSFIRMEGVQMKFTGTSGTPSIINFLAITNSPADLRVDACIITRTNTINNSEAIKPSQDATDRQFFTNNLIYNIHGDNSAAMWDVGTSSEIFFYNNTLVDCDLGIENNGTCDSVFIINNIFDCTQTFEFDGPVNSASDYNISVNSATWDEDGTDDYTENTNDQSLVQPIYYSTTYLLDATDTYAKEKGTDLSSDVKLPLNGFNTDILSYTRPFSTYWDVGAHEETTAAGGGKGTIMRTVIR